MTFPSAVPEIPVNDLDEAVDYYVTRLGFAHDFGEAAGEIAGVSRGRCRLFITDRAFRTRLANPGPIVVWLNLNSKAEVDALHAEWMSSGARIVSEPADMPWNLREFLVDDIDGNTIRVFYDFRSDG